MMMRLFGFSLQIFWKNIHKFSSKKLLIQNKMEEETQAKWNNVDGKQNKRSTAILQPVGLEKLSARFVMN